MFLRLSLVFVLLLGFEFGASKSVGNIANDDVSDDCLVNIKHILKLFSDFKANNFTSDESNVNNTDGIEMLLTRVMTALPTLEAFLCQGIDDKSPIPRNLYLFSKITNNYENFPNPEPLAMSSSTTTITSTSRPEMKDFNIQL